MNNATLAIDDDYTPAMYLSVKSGMWQVIFNASPLSSPGSLSSALAVYARSRKQGRDIRRPVVWDANRGEWLENNEAARMGVVPVDDCRSVR